MAIGKGLTRAARATGRPWRLRFSVGTGAGAAANIAVTGIETEDKLIAAIVSEPDTGDAGGLDDVSDEVSITSDGNIQLTTTNSTGKQVLVIWYDVRP